MMTNDNFNSKFENTFKEYDLNTNKNQNPTAIALVKKNQECRKLIDESKQSYKDIYNDLFNNLNNGDMFSFNSNLNKLKNDKNNNHVNIKNCYTTLLKMYNSLMNNNNGDTSEIDILQNETNEKYKKYQVDIKTLDKSQEELLNKITLYNTSVSNLNDGLLTQTYVLFYIWFIIALILIGFSIINFLDINFGLLNNILIIFTFLVASYFIINNLNNYFI